MTLMLAALILGTLVIPQGVMRKLSFAIFALGLLEACDVDACIFDIWIFPSLLFSLFFKFLDQSFDLLLPVVDCIDLLVFFIALNDIFD